MTGRYRYNELAGSARDIFTEAQRFTPARPATVQSEVIVPLFQALGCGLAAAAPTGAVCWWLGLAPDLALFAGVIVAPAAWLILLSDHRRLLWQSETIRGLPDPEPPPALPPAQTVLELTTTDDRGRMSQMQYVDLPAGITPPQMAAFAAAATTGESLAQGRWCGGGNPFSRAQYDALMSRLQSAGLIGWKAGQPSQGRELTPRGRRVLAQMAREREHARNGWEN